MQDLAGERSLPVPFFGFQESDFWHFLLRLAIRLVYRNPMFTNLIQLTHGCDLASFKIRIFAMHISLTSQVRFSGFHHSELRMSIHAFFMT